MSRIAALFITVAGLWFTSSQVASARDGLPRLMGTVHEQSAQQLQIRTTEGNIVSVGLDVHTRYEWQGKAARPGDLKPGARVVVEAEDVGGRLLARLVRIGVTAPSTGHGAHQSPATSTPAPENGARPQAHAGHKPASPRGHASAKPDSARRGPAHPSGHTKQVGSSTRAPGGMQHGNMTPSMGMAMHPLGFPAGRRGSGTSWLPDTTPTAHLMRQIGSWSVMAHGSAFVGYVAMNGPRGDERAFAPNMVMIMAERNSGPRTLWQLSGMFSADAATVGGQGYPLLFQTGETWEGRPLRDHQHPHNIFSELSLSVVQRLASAAAFNLYVAPVGEPALGPPAYPHRPVGANNILAPIGHHWQDATHIAYGVATGGLQFHQIQIEGSTFNGREPGENRAEILKPAFDSASGRLSVNIGSFLAFQVSHGYLHSPEPLHPEHDAWRTTASAVYARPMGKGQSLDGAIVWGRNRADRQDLNSWLAEGQWSRERGWTPFIRLEQVEKSGEELVLPAGSNPDRIFTLRQATLGTVVSLPVSGALSWGVGAQATLSVPPDELRDVYGRDPGGWAMFLRIRPRIGGESMME
ncbi:MAG: hypothetical protein ABIS67_01515 [Candidatus Eisenbacteria bacterium]